MALSNTYKQQGVPNTYYTLDLYHGVLGQRETYHRVTRPYSSTLCGNIYMPNSRDIAGHSTKAERMNPICCAHN